MAKIKTTIWIEHATVNFIFKGEPRGEFKPDEYGIVRQKLHDYRISMRIEGEFFDANAEVFNCKECIEINFIKR